MKFILLRTLTFVFLLLMLACEQKKSNTPTKTGTPSKEGIQPSPLLIGYTRESYDIAKYLSQQFSLIYPNIAVRLEEISAKKMDSILRVKIFDAIFTTDILDSSYLQKKLVDEIYLFALNFDNPALPKLVMKGITLDKLQSIFIHGHITNWNQVLKEAPSAPLKAFVPPLDDVSTQRLMQFFRADIFKNHLVSSYDDVKRYLQATSGGLAFLSLKDVYDVKSGIRKKGLYPLFIDFNGDHFLSDDELFYDNMQQVKSSYLRGRYPSALVVRHYVYFQPTASRPELKQYIQFIDDNALNLLEPSGYVKPK